MKFNIYFDLKGPAGIIKNVPNKTNPVEIINLASLLEKLKDNLPKNLGIETIGIRIEHIE